MSLNRLQALVYKVIQTNPGVQNNDASLIAAVWRTQGWSDDRSLESNILRVARADSITRRRRELHTMGLIQYSGEANKEREAAYVSERNQHGKAVSWL